jgi:hypothetical protein
MRKVCIDNEEKQFWSKVNKTEECWIWQGPVSKANGTGTFHFGKKHIEAGKYVWQLNGNKECIKVKHACGNKLCVNPKHLESANYDYNVEFFRNKGSDYYYLLGFALTDGCVYMNKGRGNGQTKVFEIQSKDKEWLQQLSNLLKASYSDIKRDDMGRLRIHSKEICEILEQDGCIQRKTPIVQMPQVPKKFFLSFIRGVIDGDGSVGLYSRKNNKNWKEACCTIASASLDFILSIQTELKKFGIETGISIKTFSGKSSTTIREKEVVSKMDAYTLYVQRHCVAKFFNLIIDIPFALQRKSEVMNEAIIYYSSNSFVHTPRYKLSQNEIKEVRLVCDELSIAQAAKFYGVSENVIRKILYGEGHYA